MYSGGGGGGGWGGPPASGGLAPAQGGPGALISQRERGLYAQCWALADTASQGRVGGLQAVNFLSTSGLDRKVLKQIWDIADSAVTGFLGPDEFSIALRLVAHAQAGRPMSPELIHHEPQALPSFQGMGAPPGTSNGDSRDRGRSPVRSDRLMPTPRDLRKYGRLFLTQLVGRGPNLPADNARELFGQTALPGDVLAQIWDVSDADRDGMLSWPEFVVAMHMIRRARAGQQIQQQIPVDLRNLVSGLGPAEQYAAQASRSPRRMDMSSASSLFDANSAPPSRSGSRPLDIADLPEPPASSWGTDLGPSASSPPGHSSDKMPAWDAPGSTADANDVFSAAFAEPPDAGRSSKSSRKKGSKSDPPQLTAFDTQDSISPTSRGGGGLSPDFGARQKLGGGSSLLAGIGAADSAPPVEHLEALIEAEKRLVQMLRADTDELDHELARLDESCRREEKEVAGERGEHDRIGQERLHLEQQLEASRRQLRELKGEHEGLHLESILLRRDRGHYGNEVAFLQRLFDEGTLDASALQQSIEYLEQSNQSLSAHTQSLEEARREILAQVRLEKELLRKEEVEAQSAKQALETLRGAGLDGLTGLSGFGASVPLSSLSLGGAGGGEFGFGPSAFDEPQPFGSGPTVPSSAPFGSGATGGSGHGFGVAGGTAGDLSGTGATGGASYQYRPPRKPALVVREGV